MSTQSTSTRCKIISTAMLLGFIVSSTSVAANGPIRTGEFHMPPATDTAPRLAARGKTVRAGAARGFPIAVMRSERQSDGSSINICRIEHTQLGHRGQPVLQQTQEPQR